jgi:hypothetical protein
MYKNKYTLEAEKKSRKGHSTSVDWDVVKSPEYKKRFIGITGNLDVDLLLHAKAVDILTHRNNTSYEDLYLISVEYKKIVGCQLHSTKENTVVYNDSLKSAIAKYGIGTLVSIHNHPYSKPPSGSDLSSNFAHGYNRSVIICHNGDIHVYKTENIRISAMLFDMTVEKYIKPPYNMNESHAYEFTLKMFESNYKISWEKR